MQPYSLLLADSPWWYADRRNTHTRFCGGAAAHYATMKTEELEMDTHYYFKRIANDEYEVISNNVPIGRIADSGMGWMAWDCDHTFKTIAQAGEWCLQRHLREMLFGATS